MHRLTLSVILIACGASTLPAFASAPETKVTRYARFQIGDTVAYGVIEGERVRQIDGDLFGEWKPTQRTHALSSVRLLVPSARPTQVLALAGNYKSHLGGGEHVTTVTTTTKVTTSVQGGQTTADSQTKVETEKPGEVPAKFSTPQLFFKSP